MKPSTGALSAVKRSPFTAGIYPFGIAIDPTGKFLYVANEVNTETTANSGSSSVYACKINPSTGTLSEVRGSPFATGTDPYGIAVDLKGKFLYVSNHVSANVSAFTINPNTGGALSEVSGSPQPERTPKES
jgi:DNA-binding beta-propeller fold protein YncE